MSCSAVVTTQGCLSVCHTACSIVSKRHAL